MEKFHRKSFDKKDHEKLDKRVLISKKITKIFGTLLSLGLLVFFKNKNSK